MPCWAGRLQWLASLKAQGMEGRAVGLGEVWGCGAAAVVMAGPVCGILQCSGPAQGLGFLLQKGLWWCQDKG